MSWLLLSHRCVEDYLACIPWLGWGEGVVQPFLFGGWEGEEEGVQRRGYDRAWRKVLKKDLTGRVR